MRSSEIAEMHCMLCGKMRRVCRRNCVNDAPGAPYGQSSRLCAETRCLRMSSRAHSLNRLSRRDQERVAPERNSGFNARGESSNYGCDQQSSSASRSNPTPAPWLSPIHPRIPTFQHLHIATARHDQVGWGTAHGAVQHEQARTAMARGASFVENRRG